jgi:hypothetical protein
MVVADFFLLAFSDVMIGVAAAALSHSVTSVLGLLSGAVFAQARSFPPSRIWPEITGRATPC